MRHKLIALVFFAVTFGLIGCTSERYSQTQREHAMKVDSLRVMKIQDVIKLSKAGVSDSLIIGMMDATNSWFQLKTQDVIDLRRAGVSEKVIHAMMQEPAESSGKMSASKTVPYYNYAPYYWYGGFYPYWDYPYWYYPSFSVRVRPFYHRPAFPHRGRIR